MGTRKQKPREQIVKMRLTEAEKRRVVAYAAGLSPPRSLSAWLRDIVWREAGL